MYGLDEVGLIPAAISDIKHRGDVNPFYGDKLPIFVAPMTCILGPQNWKTFYDSSVIPIYPVRHNDERNIDSFLEDCWYAVTLDEFKHYFNSYNAPGDRKYHILIDVANGHMKELYDCVKDAKERYGENLIVMIGNIANPTAYINCCEAGVDYVRIGIGGGSGCTTSVQTGIHVSIPEILETINDIKVTLDWDEDRGKHKKYNTNGFRTKIVADGGITSISRAIKALALGADYVMMGKAFAECKEGTTRPGIRGPKHNLYFGQSSEQGQLDRFGKIKANPEGTASLIEITTNLEELSTKFAAALRSAMSYCGAHNLEEFIGKVRYAYMSPVEFQAYNK